MTVPDGWHITETELIIQLALLAVALVCLAIAVVGLIRDIIRVQQGKRDARAHAQAEQIFGQDPEVDRIVSEATLETVPVERNRRAGFHWFYRT